MPWRILLILGTRPEAIKLAPVLLALRKHPEVFQARLCVTGQHRELLDQALAVFDIKADRDLNVMAPAQTLSSVTSRILEGLQQVIEEEEPDMIVVQGDTTTTFAGALAGFYAGIPVAHVEAGLRTGDMQQPFPEEMNRVLTTRLAALHFPPTEIARQNLIAEGVPDSQMVVTGNSGIDAALYVRDALAEGKMPRPVWPALDSAKRLILVTVHRRESFGLPIRNICAALENIAQRADVQIVWPVHPNPNVRPVVEERFRGYGNVVLTEPLSYVPFIDLMSRAYLLVTDSGGVQEEGPSFGKPVIVLREKTERPEAVHAGTAEVAGCNPDRIISAVSKLLDDRREYQRRTFIHNPYGDGQASARIVDAMRAFLSTREPLQPRTRKSSTFLQ